MMKPAAGTKHRRSKSFPEKSGVEEVRRAPLRTEVVKLNMGISKMLATSEKKQQSSTERSLKQEILQLERKLEDQFKVRGALETALGHRTVEDDISSEISMPNSATELMKEISILELEVVHLEQHLLFLYRKAFDHKLSSLSPARKEDGRKSHLKSAAQRCLVFSTPSSVTPNAQDISPRGTQAIQSRCNSNDLQCNESVSFIKNEQELSSGLYRCHSALSQRSTVKNSPQDDSLGRALRTCYSQPLSLIEFTQNKPNIVSLADHLGARISDLVPETPNKISEEMIKFMSAIYCKLVEAPNSFNNGLSSPVSSFSSTKEFSPQTPTDIWSHKLGSISSFDVRLDNPFLVEGFKEFSGPYSTMIEVPCIYRNNQKLKEVENLLQNFRSLVSKLEDVKPRKLKYEEKLAFWINVHNALIMHAYLAYGIPQNNVKRFYLLLKAAYNVGGHTISADTIQSSILGCRMSRPGQWLRLLIPSKSKFKIGDDRQCYAINHPEPLLHFALTSGSYSDPAVRVYSPKRIIHELDTAKEEYIQATLGVRKDQKILLPKVVESYAKESGFDQRGVIQIIQEVLPESIRKPVKKALQLRQRKSIEFTPHNYSFRYLISKQLVT